MNPMDKPDLRQVSDLDAILPPSRQPSESTAADDTPPELPAFFTITDFASACVPWNYEPNYAYPLIVWLTSPECDSDSALAYIAATSPQNYLGLTVDACSLSAADTGYGSGNLARLNASEDRIVEAVQTFRQSFNVHTDRVFLAGAGAGATTGLLIALHQADWFAGAISFGGEFPALASLLAHRREVAGRRFWLSGPQNESQWPEAGPIAEAARALVGMSADVTTCLDDSGRLISPHLLSKLDEWILARIFGVSSAT